MRPACSGQPASNSPGTPSPCPECSLVCGARRGPAMPVPLSGYVEVPLTSELYATLSPHEEAMLPLLMDAAQEMDAIFWQEAYGDRESLLGSIADPEQRRLAELNYGPWDRADG